MLDSRQGRILLGALLLAVAAIAITLVAVRTMPAAAQMPPPPRDGEMPAAMGPEQPGGWYSGPGMVPPPPAPSTPRYSVVSPSGGQVAVSATTDYVYVVHGNTLYQFSAKTLKQVNKAELAPTSSTRPVYPMTPGGNMPTPGN